MYRENTLDYDFVAPRRIIFGWGRRREVGELGRTLGSRAFMICGSRTLMDAGVADEISERLRAEGVEPVSVEVISHEPEVNDVDRVAAEFRQRKVAADDFILAVGGGAAIDLAKAVSAMATNDESPTIRDYLENVGRDLRIVNDPLPVLAMPTTAGSGTEATKNAVISCYDPPFKKSLRDERIVPRIALLDPELTVSAPPSITATSGMDAITQLLESYVSRKAQPMTRTLAIGGLKLAIPSIAEAVANGSAQMPRERMAHAALLSGMCLANSGLGMAHGVAPALGVHCRVPHGAACALMLPVAMRANREVCLADFAQLAQMLLGQSPDTPPEEAADALIDRIEELCVEVGAPRRLSELGVTADRIPAIVASSRGSSMSGNPREISDEELTELLEGIL